MKYLVIGGLGYLGSDLSDKLNKFGDVTILDPNLFQSQYEPENDMTLISKNVLMFNEAADYDVVIICSDIDIEDFYEFRHYEGYLKNYQRKIIDIAKCGAEVYYIAGSKAGDVRRKRFVQETAEACSGKKFHLVRCPELYGDNVCVRSDTFVNEVIRDFLVYKGYSLCRSPAEVIEFVHVFEYATDLVDHILNDKDFPSYDKVPAFILAEYIHWIVGHTEYQVRIDISAAEVKEIPPTEIRFINPDQLRFQITQFLAAIEQGFTEELLRPYSDRSRILSAAMIGYPVNTMLSFSKER